MDIKSSFSSSKIVLGHPISGALYAYFDKILNDSNHIKSTEWHSYYKTLYGKHFDYYMDIALTLSLMYETVIMSEADNAIPDRLKYSSDNEYYNPDFGLYLCSASEIIHYDFLEEKINTILEDTTIKSLLSSIPKHAHSLIIRQVYLDLELANKFNAQLFTFGIRQSLAHRVSEIEKFQNTDFSENHTVKVVSNYLEVTSLLFQPVDIDTFYYLKADKDLKKYASSFQNQLNHFEISDLDIKTQLIENMMEAIDNDKLNSKISGMFRGASNVLNYVGLVPQTGLVAGVSGIGASLASAGIDAFNTKNNKWYEFAPQIQKTLGLKRINDQLNQLKAKSKS